MRPSLGRIVHVFVPTYPGHEARWLAAVITEEPHSVQGVSCIGVTVFPPPSAGAPYPLTLPAGEHTPTRDGYRWRWPPYEKEG